MPPSPQPDYTSTKSSLRRASSLPPEIIRARSSTPISLLRQMSLNVTNDNDNEQEEEGVSVEELSPDAIIPDSLPILRDPEIEIPEDYDSPEQELETELTVIDLDRMHDGSESDDKLEEEEERVDIASPLRNIRKRKFTATDEPGQEEQPRKRTASPRTFSPLRRVNESEHVLAYIFYC